MQTYKCEGCEATYEGPPEQAFELGWDTPERFMSHCTCPSCAINTTAWWRLTIDKLEPTAEDMQLLAGYNQLYFEYNEQERPW